MEEALKVLAQLHKVEFKSLKLFPTKQVDVYKIIASLKFNVPYNKVTITMRHEIKKQSFFLLYNVEKKKTKRKGIKDDRICRFYKNEKFSQIPNYWYEETI